MKCKITPAECMYNLFRYPNFLCLWKLCHYGGTDWWS